jgi:hypothetical protein
LPLKGKNKKHNAGTRQREKIFFMIVDLENLNEGQSGLNLHNNVLNHPNINHRAGILNFFYKYTFKKDLRKISGRLHVEDRWDIVWRLKPVCTNKLQEIVRI